MAGIVVVTVIIVGLTSIDVSTGSPINKGDAARFSENRTTEIRERIRRLSGHRASISKYIYVCFIQNLIVCCIVYFVQNTITLIS